MIIYLTKTFFGLALKFKALFASWVQPSTQFASHQQEGHSFLQKDSIGMGEHSELSMFSLLRGIQSKGKDSDKFRLRYSQHFGWTWG